MERSKASRQSVFDLLIFTVPVLLSPGSCPLLHQCLSSSICSLLPQKLLLHCSSIRGGSTLVWTWETAWHEQHEKPAYDSGWDQMPEEDFSRRIIIESHLSGVTSQLPGAYVCQEFLSEKCCLGVQYASRDLPSVNKSTQPFNPRKHCHPQGCSIMCSGTHDPCQMMLKGMTGCYLVPEDIDFCIDK